MKCKENQIIPKFTAQHKHMFKHEANIGYRRHRIHRFAHCS